MSNPTITTTPCVTRIDVGRRFSIVLHPEHLRSVKALTEGESTTFLEETGRKWRVRLIHGIFIFTHQDLKTCLTAQEIGQ